MRYDTLEMFRVANNIPEIQDYGMGKEHNKKSEEIYRYISKLDFANGDYFCFKSGGDGDNGEFLMDLLDLFFEEEGNED